MKKMNKMAMVIGAAALAALVSCGVAELPQEVETLQEEVQYTASGKRLVNLSIPTGGGGAIGASRSLTEDLAKAAVDYYEVVFFNTSESAYYRTAGVKGRTLKISVPVGDYNNSTDDYAVIFAGTYNEKTLLATGVITNTYVGSTASNSTSIASGTTSVTFTLMPLEAEIFNDSTSAFQVTLNGYKTLDSGSAGNDNHHEITIGGRSYPYFTIPAATEDITAELTITGLPAEDLIFANADPKLNNANVINPANGQVSVGLNIDGSSSITNGDFVTSIKDTLSIEINTTLAPSDGWAAISFDIPVIAIHADAHGDQWHIRSGLNYALDGGKSTGSAILLKVGDGQEITIDSVGL